MQRGDLTLCYRARDAVLERAVFVKVLNPALAQDAEIRARFEREAKAVARLDHPNLVRIYEYGEDPKEGMYMLLEWVEGTTLAKQIAEGKRFNGDEFVRLAKELLSGLAALHGVGILHRDLKPENILVSARGTYKITDFSLAALRDAPRLTHHEAIVGTPAYMAPEQASGASPTEQSDLFAVGVILYEAATGHNPLIGETMLDTLRRIRESDVSFAPAAIANLPQNGRTVLEALLRKDADERPLSADATVAQLSGERSLEHRLPPHSRGRNIRFTLLAVAVLILGIKLIVDAGKPKQIQTPSNPPAVTGSSDTLATNSGAITENTVPEFRNPSAPDTARRRTTEPTKTNHSEEKPPPVAPALAVTPDSVDLMLTTEPWAHIYLHNQQLGTTPLSKALRIPTGSQIITLRNPAFPPIELPLTLNASTQLEVHLTDYVTTVRARVEPWGEVYVDGEHIGTTPLPQPLYIEPGQHELRISHPNLASVHRSVNTAAGQALDLEVNLNKGTFEIAMDAGGRR
jgi:serine/threonine-protein kinase